MTYQYELILKELFTFAITVKKVDVKPQQKTEIEEMRKRIAETLNFKQMEETLILFDTISRQTLFKMDVSKNFQLKGAHPKSKNSD